MRLCYFCSRFVRAIIIEILEKAAVAICVSCEKVRHTNDSGQRRANSFEIRIKRSVYRRLGECVSGVAR